MKRALALILIIAACVVGFLSIRGAMPFMPVFGTSMEPEFKAGNLITIEKISPSEVKEGDIIVFEVPAAVREYYNYPPLVAHRVIKVNPETMTFRTKGDNTGEDPFTVRAQDIKGTVGQQIPYLGLPLLFMQSDHGLIFIVVGLCLLALYLYADELSRGRQTVQRGIFAPILDQNQALARRHEQTSQMSSKALEQFATAMSEYAGHLASHTEAVKGMASASQELREAVREQNRMFSSWRGIEPTERRAKERAIGMAQPVPGCYGQNRPRLSSEPPPPGHYRG